MLGTYFLYRVENTKFRKLGTVSSWLEGGRIKEVAVYASLAHSVKVALL